MAKKITTIKSRNLGTLTESAYFSKIRSTLRNGFRWWLPMQQALKNASRKSQSSNKRLKFEYQCSHCKCWVARKDCEIDHKIPVGSLKCYDDIVPFIQRLTAEDVSSYSILCKPCHLIKTNSERIKKTNS